MAPALRTKIGCAPHVAGPCCTSFLRTFIIHKQMNQFEVNHILRMNMSPKTKLLFGFGFLVFVISVALMIIGAGNIDLAHSTQFTERACVNINGVKYCSMLTPLWSTCHIEPMIPIHMLSSGILYIVIILTIMSLQVGIIQKQLMSVM